MPSNSNVIGLFTVISVALYGCAAPVPRVVEAQPATGSTVAATAKQAVAEDARREYDRALRTFKEKRYKRAEQLLAQLTRTYPELSGPYANLGILYYRTKRLEKAEQALRKAIEINPKRADVYNHLGIVLRGNGKFAEARKAYKKALDLDADYAYAHLNLGILYDLYLINGDKALDRYERYQQLQSAQDKEVEKWIVDLKRRIVRAQKAAMR